MSRILASAVLILLALAGVNLQRVLPAGLPRLPFSAPARPLPVTPLPFAAAGAGTPAFGVYDPQGTFAGAGGLTLEQIYSPWNPEQTPAMVAAVNAIRARRRVPVVGLEPWPATWAGMSSDTLLEDVVAGRYDANIETACSALGAQSPQPVLVRWGHEMDLQGRFPWSTGDGPTYVAAYRHFVTTCRATGATNLSFVWSPGGDPGLQAYWPGAAYVDYVGMTGLGFGAWDVWRGAERPNTFAEIFGPRYELLRGYGKPVILCEFASTGPADHQRQWLQDAAAGFKNFPLLVGVVYFNAVDPVAWGEIGVPDWRVSPSLFPTVAPVAPVAPGQA